MSRTAWVKLIIVIFSLCTIFLIITNYRIYLDYQNSSDKTRAFFGIKLIAYFYKYYIGCFGVIGFITTLILSRKGVDRKTVISACVTSLLTIALAIIEFWRLFI